MLGYTLLSATIFNFLPVAQGASDACTGLKETLSLENTTILAAERIVGGSTISTPGSCQSTTAVTADACRVYAVVNTTTESAVHFEMWLPDTWYGRFLAIGNGALGGCIYYDNLDYGNALHFATIGSDNGHDGRSGAAFLNRPEVINDFAFRAMHVEAVLGKQIIDAYYNRSHDKSYMMGCSMGGRQGMQSALLYPDDFDGIVSGASATDFNHLLGWMGLVAHFLGAPNPDTSESFIPHALWPVVSQAILDQCDDLDGVKDGIISEPDGCVFRPQVLLCDDTTAAGNEKYIVVDPQADTTTQGDDAFCSFYNSSVVEGTEFDDMTDPERIAVWSGNDSAFEKPGKCQQSSHGKREQVVLQHETAADDTKNCLTTLQVDALTKVYEPVFGTNGKLLYPRFDPGAESHGRFMGMLSGHVYPAARDWYQYVIYNDTKYSMENFSVADIEFADTINPGGVATWNGNLSTFQNRGGKIVAYHGRSDQLIPAGNSKRLYNLISSTLSQPSLDDFYRLFLIPGLSHCITGQGAWAVGQWNVESNPVNDSAHNVLLALVDWVEGGNAPDVIVGTKPVGEDEDERQMQRVHCRYPHRSVFNGTAYVCED